MSAEGHSNPAFVSDDLAKPGLAAAPFSSQKKTQVLTKEERSVKYGIIKNVLIISIAFMFLFTSFNSMANLQSSINKVDGTSALSTLYAALVISCAFVPTWMINKLKVKWTIAISMLCYAAYIAAQFYPTPYTLIPTAIILGLGAAPMWSAKCTYLTQVGTKYAELVGEDSEVVITRFFGIFFLFFQSTQVWGNLISSSVLSQNVTEVTKTEEELGKCGMYFCPTPNVVIDVNFNTTLEQDSDRPELSKIYTMASIYLACALISAVIVTVFVDPLSRYGEAERVGSSSGKSGAQLLVATFQHMRHPYQLLVIPLTFWSGVEQAFIGADFTAAYVSCGLGIHMVGYVMICYGVCDAVFSVSFSPLVSKVGRVPIFTAGALINLCLIITFMYWRPDPQYSYVFFICAAFWGISDAVWQTQINALYGVLFQGQSEAAFSNYRLWESLGFIMAYACSSTVCVSTKVTIMLVVLALGMTGYYVIELLERRGGLNKDKDGVVVPIDRLLCP